MGHPNFRVVLIDPDTNQEVAQFAGPVFGSGNAVGYFQNLNIELPTAKALRMEYWAFTYGEDTWEQFYQGITATMRGDVVYVAPGDERRFDVYEQTPEDTAAMTAYRLENPTLPEVMFNMMYCDVPTGESVASGEHQYNTLVSA